ncbi:hypothetical protein [Fusibacter ferrireducens]|uniref:Uncharacterized protein n=1 Tax=Fusibacter ferrireducens TaxID=2785058 RepID=A0ABR9ZUU1_9FIRM|nr:hypothetical protein [Fusibacter ferrireducens]MBF4694239.1 hypothetical protein [Fusibacter ferrireducens]
MDKTIEILSKESAEARFYFEGDGKIEGKFYHIKPFLLYEVNGIQKEAPLDFANYSSQFTDSVIQMIQQNSAY